MAEPADVPRLVEFARARLAAGVGQDAVLAELRARGLEKGDCVRVVAEAAGLPLDEAKLLVHHSPVWADRREGDEHLEDLIWRVLFIESLVGNAEVEEPPELVAECRERRERAAARLEEVATALPEDALADYRDLLAEGLFGRAFAALVEAGRRRALPDGYWTGLAGVVEALCLDELVDEDEPSFDTEDYVLAAYEVRRRTMG